MQNRDRKSVYETVTEKIVAQLKAGVVPWHKPWSASFQPPRNLRSGKAYRGINVILLSLQGYASPYWLTFKQALDLGGNVRKGEKGTQVVLWKRTEVATSEEERAEGGRDTKLIPLVRFYTVFNVAQCDGLKVPEVSTARNDRQPIAEAQAIVAGYQGPEVRHGGNSACYLPLHDRISMPEAGAFDSMEHYYSTLFHELSHSTGHKNRLARPGIVNFDTFGSHQYSQEELVAEMGAAFLAAHSGINGEALQDNSAAYIAHWLEKLQNDPRMVVQAAGQAQKAADLILGVQFEERNDERSEMGVAA